MDSKVARLLSRVCAFCEEEGHAIMDYPFVAFHIRVGIARHVELQNVVGALMDQSHDQKQGILVIQYRLKNMELGGQLGPHSQQFVHSFNSKAKYHRCIHIHILHHKGYQWVTTKWGIIKFESTQLHQEWQKWQLLKSGNNLME